MTKVNNYEAVREAWRKRFLDMDCQQLARRFGLRLDEDWLQITYFSHPFAIRRSDGEVVRLDRPELPVSFDTAISFYTMFHYAVEKPAPSGELVPFRDVKRAAPFEDAYRRTILKALSDRFAGRAQALREACLALGGIEIKQGDVGFMLDVLPGLRIAVTFWDADEEFPAQANMLFDANITDFMHEENVVSVAADAVYYLTEAMGGQEAPHVFPTE